MFTKNTSRQGGDQDVGVRGEAGEQGGGRETADADLEHHPAPVVVAELPTEHRHQAERQGVAGDDPLQLGRAGAGVVRDGRQRDVGDAHVEEGHEQGTAADDQRDPAAAAVVGGHRPILPPASDGLVDHRSAGYAGAHRPAYPRS
jgi:hypothetical protein